MDTGKRSEHDADAAMCARTLVDTYTHRQVVQLLVRDARPRLLLFHSFSLTSSSFPALEIPDQRRVLFVVTHAALGGAKD